MNKQAVVYLLDASPSMASTVFDGDSGSETRQTRFECAKQGILQMVGNLILESKQNECSCIVLKTKKTCHHLHNKNTSKDNGGGSDKSDDDSGTEPMQVDDNEDVENHNNCKDNATPFPHLTEYPYFGLARPMVSFLRKIREIEPDFQDREDNNDTELSGGDFIDGLDLAADILQKRTGKRKFTRSIVLWTDARGYRLVMDTQQVLQLIDRLRELECQLYVVGMDFTAVATMEDLAPAEAPSSSDVVTAPVTSATAEEEDVHGADDGHRKRPRVSETDIGEEESGGGDDDDDDDEEDEDENICIYDSPEDRERLLLSLTEKTGGSVLTAQNLQQILKHQNGKPKAKRSSPRFCEFLIAPGLKLPNCKFAVWAKPETSTGSFMHMVAEEEVDEDGNQESQYNTQTQKNEPVIKKNGLGEEILHEINKIRIYCDPEDTTQVYEENKVCPAARYGSDLIEMSEYDLQGLKAADNVIPTFREPTIQVIGYKEKEFIPRIYHQGPPYRVYAPDLNSREDCGLKALSRALVKTEMVAIVMFAKTRDTPPVLAGCFPNPNENDSPLILIQLPFMDDTKAFPVEVDRVLEATEKGKPIAQDQVDLCKAMIRNLDLSVPNTDLPNYPQNPFFKAWNQTLVARALDPMAPAVTDYKAHDMLTPPDVVLNAKAQLDAFRKTFPIVSRTSIEAKKKKKK